MHGLNQIIHGILCTIVEINSLLADACCVLFSTIAQKTMNHPILHQVTSYGMGQEIMGFYITLCIVHTTQGQGQVTIVFYCVYPSPCPCPVPGPVRRA